MQTTSLIDLIKTLRDEAKESAQEMESFEYLDNRDYLIMGKYQGKVSAYNNVLKMLGEYGS